MTKLHFGNGLDTVAAELCRASHDARKAGQPTISISLEDAQDLARAIDDLRNDLDASQRRVKRGF